MISKKRIFEIIKQNKVWLGMGDYFFTIVLNTDIGDDLAEITMDPLEKLATITFSDDIKNKTDCVWENIIKHELVHGRLFLMNDKYKDMITTIKETLEEDFINDLIRWKENVK